MRIAIIAGMIGGQELMLIALLALLFFGGSKIPELMKGLGKGMNEFKKASKGEESDAKEQEKIKNE